jgi:predicted transposase/invertase (TIGR01784 family)
MGSHDPLFKHVFSTPENARAELQAALPAAIHSAIDWSTLRVEPGSFVDARLAERHSDLLFSAQLADKKAYLYLLLEHQSEPDSWMPLRLAGYVLRIWEALLRREPERTLLPVVIPVVLHHGAGGWTSARSIGALLDADPELLRALADRVLTLRLTIDDLARVAPSEIATRPGPALAALALGLLRDVRTLAPDRLLARWGPLLREVAGQGDAVVFLRYVLEVREIDEKEPWLDAIREHAGSEVEEVVVTLLEKMRAEGAAEGEARGEARGEAKGRAEVVLKLLALKFGPLDEAVIARIRASTIEELDGIAERVLTATSLREALGRAGR